MIIVQIYIYYNHRFLNPVLDNKLDNFFDSGENGYKIQYVLDFTGFSIHVKV